MWNLRLLSSASLGGCLLLSTALAEVALPKGTLCGPLQFDAEIELDPTIWFTHEVLFARYWVSKDYYQIAIVWVEPNEIGLAFPVYPISLAVLSDASSFQLRHDVFHNYITNYSKPVGDRETFCYMYGDYPITNLRFADADAAAQRLFVSDLASLRKVGSSDLLILPAGPGMEIPQVRAVTAAKACSDDHELKAIEVFGTDQRLLKRVTYDYEQDAIGLRVRRLSAFVNEQPILVGFQDAGVTVTISNTSTHLNDFARTFQKGGRNSTVEYRRVTLDGLTVNLPSYAEVRSAVDDRLLRCVRFRDYRRTKMSESDAERAAHEFAGYTSALLQSEQIFRRYLEHGGIDLLNVTPDTVRHLRTYFAQAPRAASTGEELRRIGALRDLNIILEDDESLERVYGQYLLTLAEDRLFGLILTGGSDWIETAVYAGKTALATRLLAAWKAVVIEQIEPESISTAAWEALSQWAPWEFICLTLNLHHPTNGLPVGLEFQLSGLRCVACGKLKHLLDQEPSTRDERSNARATWLTTMTNARSLAQMFNESRRVVGRYFSQLERPTSSQNELMAKVNSQTE